MATGLASVAGRLGPIGYGGQAKSMLGEARAAGLFNPTGSPRIQALMRRAALNRYLNARKRAGTSASLYGLDPSQTRAAQVYGDIAGHEGLASELGNADYNELTANRDFYKSLFGQQLGHEQALQLARQQAKAQSRGGVGQLLGTAAGLLLPGVGSFLGPAASAMTSSPYGSQANDYAEYARQFRYR